MKTILNASVSAALLLGATPLAAQTLLLDLNQNIPLASTLDNPCTAEPEAILFQGSTELLQRVWLLPNGNVRLQVAETTAMQGSSAAGLLAPSVTYAFAGNSESDLEFQPLAVSVLKYKKVIRDGASDNFHSVLVMDFDPLSLKLDLKLEAACENGMP